MQEICAEIETDKRLDTKGERRGGRNQKIGIDTYILFNK